MLASIDSAELTDWMAYFQGEQNRDSKARAADQLKHIFSPKG